MVDIIAPTEGALVFYALVGLGFLGIIFVAWLKSRKDKFVKWIRDWEEY